MYLIKRIIDVVFSLLGLLALLPILLVVAIAIQFESTGGVIFKQVRVGLNNVDFTLLKFRSMQSNTEKYGQLTIGRSDNRITKVGYFLRKYKLDELPQLFNVLKGSMSLVGPRPEVRKYVDLYSTHQMKVLRVKPGITDYASILFFDENDILVQSDNPEQTYIDKIMPQKLQMNIDYINQWSLFVDFKIILSTLIRIFR